jgi:outer membrane protein TolC
MWSSGMWTRLASVVALCSWCVPAFAEPSPLTLREAVALAVRQNPALAAAGAELEAAQGSVLAARGLDDLVLSARSEYRAIHREQALGGPLPELTSDGFAGSLRLTQPLPIGGRAAVGFETAYERTQYQGTSAGTLARSTVEQWSPALQLSLEQPLLRGFGVGVARADRRRARFEWDVASAERAGLAAALVRDVVGDYWGLAHALRELEIRRASAAAAREQLGRVRANIGVGKLPPSASAEIEVAIALRDDAVLLAERAVRERELSLGRRCGMADDERPLPSEPLPRIEPTAPLEPGFAVALAEALAQNPQLSALRARGRAAAVELEVTENGLLPQLDLSISGGPVGSAPELSAAYDRLVSLGSYALLASLSLELPVQRRAGQGALESARARLRRAELDQADVAAQIRASVARAVLVLETSQRRAAVLVPSQRAAALDLEAEKARFEVGRASNFDVLRRQDALAVVQLLLLAAELERVEVAAALQALTGEIFAQHGVRLGRGEPSVTSSR